MAPVMHNLHPLNLSRLLLGLILELPSGHCRVRFSAAGIRSSLEFSLVTEGGPAKGLPEQLWGGLQGRGRWRHPKSTSASFLCGLESFCLLPISLSPPPPSLEDPCSPARPSCSSQLPTEAKLIAGQFAVCFSLLSDFYVVFGNQRG